MVDRTFIRVELIPTLTPRFLGVGVSAPVMEPRYFIEEDVQIPADIAEAALELLNGPGRVWQEARGTCDAAKRIMGAKCFRGLTLWVDGCRHCYLILAARVVPFFEAWRRLYPNLTHAPPVSSLYHALCVGGLEAMDTLHGVMLLHPTAKAFEATVETMIPDAMSIERRRLLYG